ncbi:MAG: hypothetical protein M3R02_05625 [Chloroflexota bacterium]|nr:hypothetical protein [Chloroflexota bacterium]
MATEPESVPEHDELPDGSGEQSIPIPAGFIFDAGLLRPDETALASVLKKRQMSILKERQAKWWSELERIPNLTAVLDELLAQPETQLYARSIVEAAAPEATGLDILVHQGLQRRFEAVLLAAAYRLDADHIPATHRRLFLLSKALDALAPHLGDEALSPAEIASVVGLLEPVDLRANPPGSGLIHAVPLRPGEIAMKFTTATQRDREPYDALVDKIQTSELFGYAKARDPGGRPQRDETFVLVALAKVAAKLHHWPSPSWEHQQIAELFGWEGSAASVRERVRRAIRKGEELLDKELGGPAWRVKVPPKITEMGESG